MFITATFSQVENKFIHLPLYTKIYYTILYTWRLLYTYSTYTTRLLYLFTLVRSKDINLIIKTFKRIELILLLRKLLGSVHVLILF